MWSYVRYTVNTHIHAYKNKRFCFSLDQGVNPYVKNQEIRQLLIEVGGLSDITIQVEPHFPLEDEDCTECTSRTAFDLIAQESDA